MYERQLAIQTRLSLFFLFLPLLPWADRSLSVIGAAIQVLWLRCFPNTEREHLQRCASPRSAYFVMLFFVSCEGPLEQLVATVSASQPVEFLKTHSTKYSKRGDAQRCSYALPALRCLT